MPLAQHRYIRYVILPLVIFVAAIAALAMLVSPVARAQPAAPQAGTLVVDSYDDTNTSDTVLTLREALLIARGGTGASGLNRALSNSEKAQLSGCTINGSNFITGGCGANITDTINFSGLPMGGTITLESSLPVISDTQPTLLYSGAFAPTIDAHYFTNYGLRVTSNGNRLDGIGVKAAVISDFSVEGDNNTLYNVWAWDSGQQGVTIAGSYNTIDASRLGVNLTTDTVCNQEIDRGNTYNGVYLTGAALYATVQNSYLGCNGSGITIVSTNTATHHTLGPNNRIGVNQSGAGNLGNLNSGVSVGAQNNVVMSNTISHNGSYGVMLTGDWNYVGGNTIRSNSKAGVELHAWASNNTIGKLSIAGSVVSNTISSNLGHGILISDTNAPPGFNVIIGNQIGVSADGQVDAGNSGDGILVFGAHDTYIGGGSTQRNIVSGNAFSGINLAGGTYNSHVLNNSIGVGYRGTALPNDADGIQVQGGAHDNIIGVSNAGNTIKYNGGVGILIINTATATNTVDSNSIISNTLAGVAIRSGAHDNFVRTNLIRLNGSAGVLIDGGANNNRIGEYGSRAYGNVIGGNVTDGIYIGGTTTRYNAVVGNNIGTNVTGTVADPNLHTGLTLDAGAYGNLIGEYITERNVIAGNAWDGVLLINGVHDNSVWSNDIGLNRDYAPVASQRPDRPTGGGGSYLAIPNGGGVSIVGSYTNTIGGYIGLTDVANFISHNTHTGVYLTIGLSPTQHNVIGSNLVSANGDYGVLLDGGNTAYNTITRTQIYSNGLDGVGERNSAGFNVWSEVGIHDNGGLGIDRSASNDGQNIVNAPNLVFDSINKQTGVVQGHADASVLGTVKIELYRVAPDPSGYGEGGVFLGRATTDVSGNWVITDTSPLAVRGCYTAFVTESQVVIPFSSSEFSANTCRVFLPITTRQ